MMKLLLFICLLILEGIVPARVSDAYRQPLGKEINFLWKDCVVEIEEVMQEASGISGKLAAGRLTSGGKTLGYFIYNRVNACMEGGCSNPHASATTRYDHFYYLAIYDLQGKIIKIKITDYQSERGYEIASRWWLRQFTGYQGNEIRYEKEVDALAGATVSAKALIEELNFNTETISALRQQ